MYFSIIKKKKLRHGMGKSFQYYFTQLYYIYTFSCSFSILFIGGELIFDEKDVELFADNILIVEGGKLQVKQFSVIQKNFTFYFLFDS